MLKYSPFIFFTTSLLIWIFCQAQIRIPADGAWLMLAAEKFLNHIPMTQGYWDNNPPLIYLIYTPAIWIAHLFTIDLVLSYSVYVSLLLFVSFFLINTFVSYYKSNNYIIFLIGYIISITFVSFAEFGQKDHLIAITLPVFILAQYALTAHHPIPKRYTHLAFLMSTPFILLKPHFGLLPVALLLHRFYKKRSLNVIKDPDFIYLSIGVLLYGFVIFFFFSDFIEEVLPIALDLYALSVFEGLFTIALFFSLFCVCLLIFIWAQEVQREDKELNILFASMALLSTIAVSVQGKGFSVHLLPIFSLLLPALCSSLYAFTPRLLLKKNHAFQILCSIIIMSGLYVFLLHSSRYQALHKDTYLHSNFSEFIERNAQESSFFAESWSTNMIVSTAIHHNLDMTSRFSSVWFVPDLLWMIEMNSPKASPYKAILGQHLYEDIRLMRPKILLLFNEEYESQNLLTLFQDTPYYEYVRTHYKQEETLTFSFGEEHVDGRDFVTYDIYRRKNMSHE